ncbi:MAG: methyltransferase FkbM [Epsilonproteobacteria bacterium]|nr:MAG: methyltransferase FkbM [Campylobacterota bacterium]
MFTTISTIKRKLRGFSLKVFNYIENNGNSNFDTNGEEVFIDNLMNSFKNDGERKRIVFDIGANIGIYSQMIHNKSNKMNISLYLFEPTKSCFDTIFIKFESEKNIQVNNFGASDSNTMSTIYYDKEQSGLASLYQRNLDSYNLKLDKSEEITLRRLDNYIEEHNIEHIDFVKIDIEGHELKALEGFGKYLNGDFIDYIQFEYGGTNLDAHTSLMDIYKFLEERGFNIAKIMPKGIEIRNYTPYMDNFNYANYVAVSKRIA